MPLIAPASFVATRAPIAVPSACGVVIAHSLISAGLLLRVAAVLSLIRLERITSGEMPSAVGGAGCAGVGR